MEPDNYSILRYYSDYFPLYIFYITITMTDQRREQPTYPQRSVYMHYIHTTEMARRHEKQIQLAQLDEEIRRDEAMMLKRQHDSRMKTEQAIRELRLEQEQRLIKAEQRRQEHEERRRIRNQNREQLKRELERIKDELRADLAKEDKKCQKAEEERQQHKEEERKRLASIHEREERLKHTAGRQPAVELKTKEHMQRHEEIQSTATGRENKRIEDEKGEEEQRDAERGNEHKTCMVNDETSDEKRETEVQTGYRKTTHEYAMSSDDTVQQDCTCNSVLYGQVKTSCAQTTTLEVLQNTDRQEISVDHTLGVCIVQECASDDIVQSDCAPAILSDEQLQVSRTKITSLKVHHDTDLQKKAMQLTLWMYVAQERASDTQVPQSLLQLKILLGGSEIRNIVYAKSRNIVMTCKNCSLCFKFLWWQDGLLMS